MIVFVAKAALGLLALQRIDLQSILNLTQPTLRVRKSVAAVVSRVVDKFGIR